MDSVLDLSLLDVERAPAVPRAAEEEVLLLFDACAAALVRYVGSFGLTPAESEDIVQDVFLALFRHLKLDRSRSNLKAWLFQVAHNLALKQRRRNQRRATTSWDETAHAAADSTPSAEMRLVRDERLRRLKPVLQALPARDRRCLALRAEGLRYRDIASTLGMSLGAVANSLARSITRLVNADRG